MLYEVITRILNAMGQMVHTLGLKWPEEAYVEDEERPEYEEDKVPENLLSQSWAKYGMIN